MRCDRKPSATSDQAKPSQQSDGDRMDQTACCCRNRTALVLTLHVHGAKHGTSRRRDDTSPPAEKLGNAVDFK